MFLCLICGVRSADIANYRRHLGQHKFDKNKAFKCYICNVIYTNFNSYKSHCYRNHYVVQNKVSRVNFSCPFATCENAMNYTNRNSFRSHMWRAHKIQNPNTNEYLVSEDGIRCEPSAFAVDDVNISAEIFDAFDVCEKVGKLFLELKVKFSIPEPAFNHILSNLSNIFHSCNKEIHKNISKFCEKPEMKNFEDEFKNRFQILYDLSPLQSSYRRNKFFHSHLKFIPPVQVYLGKTDAHKDAHYNYVPINKTLSTLFEDEKVIEQFIMPRHSEQGVFTNYTSGSIYWMNQFLSTGDRKIELILYQDAFELCNPLSSSKKKQKLIGVYMILGNLDDSHKSRVNNIFRFSQRTFLLYFSKSTKINLKKIPRIAIYPTPISFSNFRVNCHKTHLNKKVEAVKAYIYAQITQTVEHNIAKQNKQVH